MLNCFFLCGRGEKYIYLLYKHQFSYIHDVRLGSACSIYWLYLFIFFALEILHFMHFCRMNLLFWSNSIFTRGLDNNTTSNNSNSDKRKYFVLVYIYFLCPVFCQTAVLTSVTCNWCVIWRTAFYKLFPLLKNWITG